MAAEAWVQPEHGHWQGLLCSLVEEREKTERRKEEVGEDDRWDLRPPQQIVQIGMPHRPDMWAPPVITVSLTVKINGVDFAAEGNMP